MASKFPRDFSDTMNMQQAREGFNPTSPHSSSGAADSFKGTPDTRLTAFSPEDGSARSTKALRSLHMGAREAGPINYSISSPRSAERPSSFYRGNLHLEKDPFVTSSATNFKSAQKLSPTASVFSPLHSALIARGSASEPTGAARKSLEDLKQDYIQASGQSSPRKPYSAFVHDNLSTENGISRCLVISAAGRKVVASDVERYLSDLQQVGYPTAGSNQVYECGDKVFVRFSNIRDACAIFSNLTMGGRDWAVTSVSSREFSLVVEPGAGLVTSHEGQLYLSVFAYLVNNWSDSQQLEAFLKNLLQSEGDLFAFKVQDGVEGSLMSAVVEYCDNDMSLRAISKFNGVVITGLQICMTLYRPDIPSMTNANHDGIISPIRNTGTTPDLVGGFQRMSIARPHSVVPAMSNALVSTPARSTASSGFQVQPPYGMMPVLYQGMPVSPPYMLDQPPHRSHSAMLSSSNYSLASPVMPQPSPYMSADYMTPRQFQNYGRRSNAVRITRSGYCNAANHHNHVDVSRIREGTDVRTTIMLRNIPNKVDQALLKRIVDESSWGKYDFMYLRIDFANDCNVGYAFINFVDPLDIIDFVNARGNQRWNCFKSDKVAEISYATIQGKDCLVQKFRNSSVMLEAAHYRPKLFYTLNGPRPELAGSEEPFPEPDNQSKMKRSCENAEHVGLFTPNAGQHFRDEQRRRRSQFDRGTRLAALEEIDYDTTVQHNPFYSPQ
ncbi:RNA recognition motif 2-domain-containing protein [Whalleya microplaca]|nr:RNA recognition motif 2-domain-containing protein [Whalleya microplaca]